ncbi:hypothetical protein AAW14_21260 [Streptomyces hygroscopicus]|nr:hypothetical protein [Streptomyces hygroscopicus]
MRSAVVAPVPAESCFGAVGYPIQARLRGILAGGPAVTFVTTAVTVWSGMAVSYGCLGHLVFGRRGEVLGGPHPADLG